MAGRYYICLTSLLLALFLAQSPPVVFDHDGGTPDDFVALAMLAKMPNIDLRGVVVSPGVSFSEPAVSVTRKVLDLAGRTDVPVANSISRGINPFPTVWRKGVYVTDALPILNQHDVRTPLSSETGAQFLIRLVKASQQPMTILATGPLTTVADALKLDPSIAGKIARIVWMGGALRVPGNVSRADEPSHDGSAEWNVYFDPVSAAEVWKTKIPIVLCPLDTTNHVPVAREILRRLAAERSHPLADFAGQIIAQSFAGGDEIYFWDALAAAWVGKPDLFKPIEWEVSVIAEGPSQGRTIPRPGSGRKIQVMEAPNVRAFYDYFFQLLTAK